MGCEDGKVEGVGGNLFNLLKALSFEIGRDLQSFEEIDFMLSG